MFAALAEFERELIAERTNCRSGIEQEPVGGNGGRPYKNDAQSNCDWQWHQMGTIRKQRSVRLCQDLGYTRPNFVQGIFPLLVNCGRTGFSCSTRGYI
ncbi:hypothetical protein [Klebsiella pneumoniae]|uniref:hypothetical protein n=1 Tax=Klebsiella pneumoniae TaxID=573 RepID=UPI002D1E347E|nr:hypothetical protein [Klebsiella pneumoniae]